MATICRGEMGKQVRACSINDVPPGAMKKVKADSEDLLIANVDGKYYAMNNWCTHAEGDLSEGGIEGKVVTCPDHGAQFDVTTGEPLLGPRGKSADMIGPEKTHPTTIKGSDVYVEV